jgi:hypothetical protein
MLSDARTHMCCCCTLAAVGERNPQLALRINTAGEKHALSVFCLWCCHVDKIQQSICWCSCMVVCGQVFALYITSTWNVSGPVSKRAYSFHICVRVDVVYLSKTKLHTDDRFVSQIASRYLQMLRVLSASRHSKRAGPGCPAWLVSFQPVHHCCVWHNQPKDQHTQWHRHAAQHHVSGRSTVIHCNNIATACLMPQEPLAMMNWAHSSFHTVDKHHDLLIYTISC